MQKKYNLSEVFLVQKIKGFLIDSFISSIVTLAHK